MMMGIQIRTNRSQVVSLPSAYLLTRAMAVDILTEGLSGFPAGLYASIRLVYLSASNSSSSDGSWFAHFLSSICRGEIKREDLSIIFSEHAGEIQPG